MPRALAYRSRDDAEPFSALNITPLIDVMLVLLIMLIVTIPSMTHKVPVDLPQGETQAQPSLPNRLDIAADGSLFWDGARDHRCPAPRAAQIRSRCRHRVADQDRRSGAL
ncbi:biopolymer transporter ExbD [Sphingomonas sp. J315]|uniref:ExbD/TolR family protein n=1 Tax=Sphingomonas sp. J315 TaxID=2898433 RepID=UPI0021AD8182|nr:biopolymer transporter ExbD [Sphingomonas sp. J315]UUX98455.1 biopolymer transporter ExbD [Sphingomonas sp. J315]